ncbi:hypothetical protein PG999_004548 [Apiospora kogelbergensis]|uniref:DUF7053 domain-containing protein n=1 Tax=Apiospora kogelbergensis TaxID=1337665 RepID=A0AAW0QZN8_9PEZI
MSFLQGGFTLCNKTPLPAGLTKPAAIAALQNHDQFLSADPHLTSYKRLSEPEASADYDSYQVPSSIVPIPKPGSADGKGGEKIRVYEVHDHVPNPVWSSDVTSVEEFVDCADGVWVRVRSPMGIVLETTWFVCEIDPKDKKNKNKDLPEGATLELVQTCECRCNRLLATLCKGQIDKGWPEVHEKIIKGMMGGGAGGNAGAIVTDGGGAAAGVAAPATATVAA